MHVKLLKKPLVPPSLKVTTPVGVVGDEAVSVTVAVAVAVPPIVTDDGSSVRVVVVVVNKLIFQSPRP